MRNSVFRALGKSILLATFLAAYAPAFAADAPEIRCRAGVEAGLGAFEIKTLKARLRCQSDILDGYESPGANCVTGFGSVSLPGRLASARERLLRRIVKSCGGARWNLMSYPGPCPEAPVFTEQTLAQCIDGWSRDVAEALFDVWYPSELTPARGATTECIKGVAKRASAMVLREMKVRLECLLRNERPDVDSDVDCRGQIPPYGDGTFDEKVNESIVRAEEAWLDGLPGACIDDFPSMGFGENCPDGAGTGLSSFHSCVYRTNRLQIPLLVDLAFPSAPVCGNGIPQEGEACDEGVANSDTAPDACRSDCTLPACGDGTADPSNREECDDGDHEDLDGCTADCQREFCGDGQVNDLPHEDCEDGNDDDHDLCTNDCTDAACGDGVVCSDPACTSGPGGGPELCDNGASNAAGAICKPDCSGFQRSCTLKIRQTNAVTLGSLTYDFLYATADGEVAGSGADVACTSLLSGGALASFFDNENTRRVRESVIIDNGVATPADIAQCTFFTNDAGLVAGDFAFSVVSATDTSFEPVTATLAVSSLVCVTP